MYKVIQVPLSLGEVCLSLLVFFILMSALHELLSDNLSAGLADHTPNTCIVCTPEAFSEDEVSIVATCMYMGLQH